MRNSQPYVDSQHEKSWAFPSVRVSGVSFEMIPCQPDWLALPWQTSQYPLALPSGRMCSPSSHSINCLIWGLEVGSCLVLQGFCSCDQSSPKPFLSLGPWHPYGQVHACSLHSFHGLWAAGPSRPEELGTASPTCILSSMERDHPLKTTLGQQLHIGDSHSRLDLLPLGGELLLVPRCIL